MRCVYRVTSVYDVTEFLPGQSALPRGALAFQAADRFNMPDLNMQNRPSRRQEGAPQSMRQG